MFSAKVDARFLGTIQNTFYGLPELPQTVKTFLLFLAGGILLLSAFYAVKKFKLIPKCTAASRDLIKSLSSNLTNTERTGTETSSAKQIKSKRTWKGKTDLEILERLVMTGAKADLLGERSGQRTLAAVVNISGIEKNDVIVTFNDVVTGSLLTPNSEVKCMFDELQKDSKKVNAFVGKIKSFSPTKGAVITRTSSFGFIRRRAFARRKVADQRYIKIKIWRLEDAEFDVDYMLDNTEPDIIMDNRSNKTIKSKDPHVLDISKGGLGMVAAVRPGGNTISRNDKVLLCMLIYLPKKRTFQPHLIYAETRSSRAMGLGMTRLSFQFLRSLKIPPRKRSTLFRGQAVMAMQLNNPE